MVKVAKRVQYEKEMVIKALGSDLKCCLRAAASNPGTIPSSIRADRGLEGSYFL